MAVAAARTRPRADGRGSPRTGPASGASLVGLLLVIVVLGGMTAFAVVGVSSLTGTGPTSAISTTSTAGSGADGARGPAVAIAAASAACRAAAGAATAASEVYYVNSGGKAYPAEWADLTSSTPPLYALSSGVAVNRRNPVELDGRGWQLVMAGGGASAPGFTCR